MEKILLVAANAKLQNLKCCWCKKVASQQSQQHSQPLVKLSFLLARQLIT